MAKIKVKNNKKVLVLGPVLGKTTSGKPYYGPGKELLKKFHATDNGLATLGAAHHRAAFRAYTLALNNHINSHARFTKLDHSEAAAVHLYIAQGWGNSHWESWIHEDICNKHLLKAK